MPEPTDTCAHKPCRCPAPMAGDYCSEQCEQAATGDFETDCRCGHPQCGQSA
jgi:hypothetical protein